MRRTLMMLVVLSLAVSAAGCGRRKPAIPHAAFRPNHVERLAIDGSDTTRAVLAWPEFVAASSGEALDSLNATVQRMALASLDEGGGREDSPDSLLHGFLDSWREARRLGGSRATWYFDRTISVAGDTLNVVTLSCVESAYSGGAHPNTAVVLVTVDATSGRTLRFDDLFRAGARDSLSAALEPSFRALKAIAPDSSLKEAGFWFEDGRFHVNDNVGVGPRGVTFFFNPYEIAPYVMGPTELEAPYDVVRPFVNPSGPLAAVGRR